MSQYDEDVEIHDSVDMVVGSEDFEAEDQESAVLSQRCEFFELSPDIFDVCVFHAFLWDCSYPRRENALRFKKES